MAKSGTPQYEVVTEVLQNGKTVASSVNTLKKGLSLRLTADEQGELCIPHYPLPNNTLEFMESEGSKSTKLLVEYNWEGFCTSGGRLVNISLGEKGRQEIDIEPGDYGSISRHELRILFKIVPRKKASLEVVRKRPMKSYRSNWMGFIVPGAAEGKALGFAFLAMAVILGGVIGGLFARPYFKPAVIDDLASEYILPFINDRHLKNGPEALQANLNRADYLRSVAAYYRSFTRMLMGWPGFEQKHLFESSIKMYEALHASADELVAELKTQQNEINNKLLMGDAGIFTVPAVLGESQSGKMLRVIDKTRILHKSLEENLEHKRRFIEVFASDPNYDYEKYKAASPYNALARSPYKDIKVFPRTSDEGLMYETAEKFAKNARVARDPIKRASAQGKHLDSLNAAPVLLPPGVNFASFLGNIDFMLADDKIELLKGTEFVGTKKRKSNKVSLTGIVDRDLIQKYIESKRYQLKLCYDIALRRNEAASGTMEWSFRIDPRGRISNINLISTTIKDDSMTHCIKSKLSKWKFPRPRKGSVEIQYPFEFFPAKG